MAKRTYIEFGEMYLQKEFNIWTLPVKTLYHGKEAEYYLQLFRGKAFQVSATDEGELDCGCSNVIPEFVNTNPTIMYAFAIEALSNFGSCAYSDLRFSMNSSKRRLLEEFVKRTIATIR